MTYISVALLQMLTNFIQNYYIFLDSCLSFHYFLEKMKNIIFLILIWTLAFATFPLSIAAQNSPYKLQLGKDLAIAGGVLGINALNYGFIYPKVKPLSPDDILLLNRNSVNNFDRMTTYQWHPQALKISDVMLIGSAALPFLTVLDKPIRQDWKTIAILGLETFAVNVSITNMTKHSVLRTRPFVYNPDAPLSMKTEKDARFSFFSGHTSTVSSMSFFAATVYSDYHPKSKALPYIWGTAAALPALTAYLRVRGGKHFPTDVITGYLVGAAVGFLIPKLHKIR